MYNKNVIIKPKNIIPASTACFQSLAFEVFQYQYAHNQLYHDYCNALHINTNTITQLTQIPFLPVSFFKSHQIVTNNTSLASELIFESSGTTTGAVTSKHYVLQASAYEQPMLHGFEQYYGNPAQYVILALLPSYVERKNASLVYMARLLMQQSGHPDNGFYIHEWDMLFEKIKQLIVDQQKVILLGVTFALLDFAAAYPSCFKDIIVMETGGMKGRREEWTRKQVHDFLKIQWQLNNIHSEYGMTELLSQAYSKNDGIYNCTDTMRVLVRDVNDPLEVTTTGNGCINIIDLANVDSCSFIATEDMGTVYADGSFEILGRMDHSALRGCSLMAV